MEHEGLYTSIYYVSTCIRYLIYTSIYVGFQIYIYTYFVCIYTIRVYVQKEMVECHLYLHGAQHELLTGRSCFVERVCVCSSH